MKRKMVSVMRADSITLKTSFCNSEQTHGSMDTFDAHFELNTVRTSRDHMGRQKYSQDARDTQNTYRLT